MVDEEVAPTPPSPGLRTWRVRVVEGSMRPGIEPGDWLLIDPTTSRWPRRGSIVLVTEPGSETLVLKRVAARPGDTVRPGAGEAPRQLGPTEAWLLGDAREVSIDSRRYGPVALDRLVGRAWFRYGPAGRPIGPLTRLSFLSPR